MVTVTDASFCNEIEYLKGQKLKYRSQQGYMCVLANPGFLNAETSIIHPMCWGSTIIKRVCGSTLMAETYAMKAGHARGDRLRAAIVDARGLLDPKDWESSAADNMLHVWVTDCDSLYEHLVSNNPGSVDDKRLGIDLAILRQFIWERENASDLEPATEVSGDYPRWVDTSAMLVDPLTKILPSDMLVKALNTGVYDMRATAESTMIKEKNRKSRQAKRELEQKAKVDSRTGGNLDFDFDGDDTKAI
jgi:hypothetical protein